MGDAVVSGACGGVPVVFQHVYPLQKCVCGPADKETMQGVVSPRASSAWSTQDGFAQFFDPERDHSLECSQDVACTTSWAIGLPSRSDQCGDAACTSRSSDLRSKQEGLHKDAAAGASSRSVQPAAHSDADAHPDTSRQKQQRLATPAERQRLRAARQLEELVAMIRNEQVLEREVCPSSGFLEQQNARVEQPITPQMLMIVSSWLAEVAFEFSMQQETLFLAVALLGRFLDASSGVPRSVLQLVAVACIMLAAKQDEVVHPTMQELTDISANCFTTADLLRMERILLDSLSWRVKTPTAYTFLHLFTQSTAAMRAAGGIQACTAMARGSGGLEFVSAPAAMQTADPLSGSVVAKAAYLTELALLDYGMLDFRPSQVAAAAVLLAQSWSPQGAAVAEMQAISGFSVDELQSCTARLLRLHQYADAAETCESLAPLEFIKDKYAQDCWLQASLQAAPTAAACGAPADFGTAAAAPDVPHQGQHDHGMADAQDGPACKLPRHEVGFEDGSQPMDL